MRFKAWRGRRESRLSVPGEGPHLLCGPGAGGRPRRLSVSASLPKPLWEGRPEAAGARTERQHWGPPAGPSSVSRLCSSQLQPEPLRLEHRGACSPSVAQGKLTLTTVSPTPILNTGKWRPRKGKWVLQNAGTRDSSSPFLPLTSPVRQVLCFLQSWHRAQRLRKWSESDRLQPPISWQCSLGHATELFPASAFSSEIWDYSHSAPKAVARTRLKAECPRAQHDTGLLSWEGGRSNQSRGSRRLGLGTVQAHCWNYLESRGRAHWGRIRPGHVGIAQPQPSAAHPAAPPGPSVPLMLPKTTRSVSAAGTPGPLNLEKM